MISRDHPAQGIGLQERNDGNEGGKEQAVQHGKSKQIPLSANQVTGRSGHSMDCGEIIFAATPPELLAATVRTGSTPISEAVTACILPNKALAEVSEPVIKTPNQPSIGETKGNRNPVTVKALPRVGVILDQLAT